MDRERALRWAAAHRDARERLLADVASGALELEAVLDRARTDAHAARTKLLRVLEAVPGAGKVATRRRLAELGIGEDATLGEVRHRAGDLCSAPPRLPRAATTAGPSSLHTERSGGEG